ncbi:MAG: methyl-accepting chemotaxis protein [Pseudomonadota bacterium]
MSSPFIRSAVSLLPLVVAAVVAVGVAAAIPSALLGGALGLGLLLPGAAVSGLLIARHQTTSAEGDAEPNDDAHALADGAADDAPRRDHVENESGRSQGGTMTIMSLAAPCILLDRNGSVSQVSAGFETFVERSGAAFQIPGTGRSAAEALLHEAGVDEKSSGTVRFVRNSRSLRLVAFPIIGCGTLVAVVEDEQANDQDRSLTVHLSLAGRVTEVSSAFAAAIGRRPEDVVGQPLASFARDANSDEYTDMFATTSAGGVIEVMTSAGKAKWLAFAFDGSSADGAGRKAHAVDLNAVAPELLGEVARFRSLSRSWPIMTLDNRKQLSWLNDKVAAMLGRSRDDMVAQAQSSFFGRGAEEGVSTAQTRSGDTRWLRRVEAPLDDGAEGERLCLLVDVTDQQNGQGAPSADQHTEQEALSTLMSSVGKSLARGSIGDAVPLLPQPYPDQHRDFCVQFNKVMNLLNVTRSSLARTVEPISVKASVIESAAQDMAERTESQAATLEESTASLEQLSGNLQTAVKKTNDIEREIEAAQSSAREGESVVKDAVSAMGEISTSSDEISQIIGLIDDIAFQTNLLALNAGVEAARAGDAGRGFAVVASEVRALAQRSSDAAKQIKDLISKSAQEVSNGVALVDKTGAVLEGIVEAIDGITGRFVEINASTKEQAEGLAEVTTAVSDLDRVTQQNAAMAEENIAVGRELREGIATLAALGSAKGPRAAAKPSANRAAAKKKPPARRSAQPAPARAAAAATAAASASPVHRQQAQAASVAAQLTPANSDSAVFDDDWTDF